MKIRKTIRKDIKHRRKGVDVVGGVDAVISANVGEGGSESRVSSSQRIVQRSRRTAKAESKAREPERAPREDAGEGHGDERG
jgi:hypothetical protein